MEQNVLIFIDDASKFDASAAANAFAQKEIKNRAYFNTLGTEIIKKYLSSENVDVSNVQSVCSVKKVLEKFDISDIILRGLHIDVRVVFDENVIFVPKSHFEYGITPDIYVVLQISKDFVNGQILGFFEPKLINKNNSNDEYYFIEKEKLSSCHDFIKYIQAHTNGLTSSISDDDFEASKEIMLSFIDNDVTESDLKTLMKNLIKSSELREEFIEYENFERLSSKAMSDSSVEKKEVVEDAVVQDEFDMFDSLPEESIDIVKTEEPQSDNLELETLADESLDVPEESSEDEENKPADDGLDLDINAIPFADAEVAAAGMAAGLAADAVDFGADILPLDEVQEVEEPALELSNEVEETEESNLELQDDAQTEEEPELETLDEIEPTEDSELETLDDFVSVEEPALETLGDIESTDEPSLETLDETEEIAEEPVLESLEEIQEPSEEIEPLEDLSTLDDAAVETVEEVQNFDDETVSSDTLETLETLENSDISDENAIADIDTDLVDMETIDELPAIETEDLTDNVEVLGDITDNEQPSEDTVSFDSLASTKEESNQDFNTDSYEPVTTFDDNGEISFNSDDIENSESTDGISLDNVNEYDSTTITENIEDETVSLDALEQSVIHEVPEVYDADEKDSSFGKNLLENLSVEDEDSVSIEEIDSMFSKSELPKDTSDMTSDEISEHLTNALGSNSFDSETDSENFEESIKQNSDIEDLTVEENVDIDNSDAEKIEYDDDDVSQEEMPNSDIDSSEDYTEPDFENNEEISSKSATEDADKLNVLYSEDKQDDVSLDDISELEDAEDLNDLEKLPDSNITETESTTANKQNKPLILAAVLVVAAALAGFSLMKPKASQQAPVQNELTEANATSNISENPLETNTPELNEAANIEVPTDKTVQELKDNAVQEPKASNSAYMDVSKVVWDVPDELAKSTEIQSYLRTAGKSIKVSLSADLLLADEYAYANYVKIGLRISKSGSLLNSQILSSSGSKQIDNIVLQSVKDTLNTVKPANGAVNSPDFNLSIIIYF